MNDLFETYLAALRQDRGDKTEHSDRGALEILLNAAAKAADPVLRIVHEARRNHGNAPDFKIMKSAMILGYVENKTIGENLDKVLRSEQIARYKAMSNNILLTDYLQFIWIKDGKVNGREAIAGATDLDGEPRAPRQDRVEAVSILLRGFFSSAPEGIGQSAQLALALATRSHFLRDFLDREMRRQQKSQTEGRLYGLYLAFRDQVFHELSPGEFADAFAQMLAYGLFLARLNAQAAEITLRNARDFIPGSFRLIREMVQFLDDLSGDDYVEIRWVVEEILSIVNGLDLAAIHADLSFADRKAVSREVKARDEEEHRLFERDPFIYFYEDFLGKYDAKMKKTRGVYYTPPPIVNFIVRAIDDILKGSFAIPDGLADHRRVTVLDFACGTGTFLVEVLERIFENIGGADSGKAALVVREHVLKNIYGFEYLLAPYTIAHLKLSQYLADKGHALTGGDRLQVFLTNTLEPIKPQRNFLLPALTEETRQAQEIKDRKILVVTGNPPYSGHSKNKGAWISAVIDEYKFIYEKDAEGREHRKPLGEKNPKWLNDDYVKFIRFAQMKMDGAEEGIVGIITNHSWLDNPTFRGMRQSLMRSFDQIYVLDLHGNAKKRERAADGTPDINVFDIEQGVAIALLVKRKGVEKGVWRADWRGKRLEKYKLGASQSLASVEWKKIEPCPPFDMFVEQDCDALEAYMREWSVPEIFPINVLGFQTHRDKFAIGFGRQDIETRVRDMADVSLSDDIICEKHRICDNRDWKVATARKNLRTSPNPTKDLMRCSYRPFDARWTLFSEDFIDYPRKQLKLNVAGQKNLQLLVPRQISVDPWRHVLVAEHVAESCLISNLTSEGNYNFPLYLFPVPDRRNQGALFGTGAGSRSRVENIASAFRAWLDARYPTPPVSPEDLFGYIYAVLHAPAYRDRHAEFLRIDFPRIPFPERHESFAALAAAGWDLAQKHLLRSLPASQLGIYRGKGDNVVEAPRFSEAEQCIHINATQYFAPVPPNVWTFQIGSHQVVDKYLASRAGRVLALEEIDTVRDIVRALAFTIARMGEIDELYRAAFAA